jgi:hypothetical protein
VKNLGNVEAKVGEMVPFGWAVSQKNHLLSKVIDLNSFRAATMRAIDNEQLGEFGNDLRAVEAGLKQMLRNYQDGNPGETGLGVTRKNILNGLLGTGTVTQRQNNPAWYTLNNQGSVRTFRFDRLNYADPYGTGYFPHYNKININALPDDAGRMSMDSYRQFDADRKVAWMNKEAAKRGFSNATNWQNADAQGFQAADAQYRQEFPTESMPQQIPRSAQGMPDVAASGRGDGMPSAPRRYVPMEQFINEAGDDLGAVLANAYADMDINEDRNALVGFVDTRNSMYRQRIPVKEFFDWLHSDEPMRGLVFDSENKPATPGEGASYTREGYEALLNRLRDISLRKPKSSAAPRGQAMPDAGPQDGTVVEGRAMPILSVGPTMVTAFHGTPRSFTKFDASKARSGDFAHGIYFAIEPDEAATYGPQVKQATLDLKNPAKAPIGYEWDAWYESVMGTSKFDPKALTKKLQQMGHDALIVGNDQIVVFDPKAIKGVRKFKQ